MKSFRLESNKEKKERKKSNIFSWKLSNEELKNQIDNYHNLGFFRSYRKISAIIVLYFILSAVFGLTLGLTPSQVIPAIILYLILIAFIYKGHRWSFVLLMIIFTIEMIYKEIEGYQMLDKIRVYPLIIWLILMPYVYKALKIEIKRKKMKNETNINKNGETSEPQIYQSVKKTAEGLSLANNTDSKNNLTIKILRTKIWYRFIKVIFVLTFIFSLYAGVGIFMDERGSQINPEKSSVFCNFGNKKRLNNQTGIINKLILLSEVEWRYRDQSDLSREIKIEIQKLCEVSEKEANIDLDKLITLKLTNDDFSDYKKEDWIMLLGIVLSIILLEEVIRRIFYYIILGKFFPTKK